MTILPGGVGHYTFLDVGTDAGKKKLPQFFVDNPGVDREAVHKQVAEMAAGFFDRELASPQKEALTLRICVFGSRVSRELLHLLNAAVRSSRID